VKNRERELRDFVIRPSKNGSRELQKPRGGGEYDPEEYKEMVEVVSERKLDRKFRNTVSKIRCKDIKDPEAVYLVVEFSKESSDNKKNGVIQKLDAKVHDYLDKKHNTALVSVSASFAKRYERRNLPIGTKEPLIDIRELKLDEQISKGIRKVPEWETTPRSILVHTIPNVDVETTQKYVGEVAKYLKLSQQYISWSNPKQGMLLANLQKTSAETLLEKTNVVYKLEPLPLGIATSIIAKKPTLRSAKPASLTPIAELGQVTSLPLVCVADTGLNNISQLSHVTAARSKENDFATPDDSDANGHGTPISYLVSFGEEGKVPRARIISHKIYSEGIPNVAFDGMFNAIDTYAPNCRIFTSSITFSDEDSEALLAYSKLDRLIQEKNICFVSAAGNLPYDLTTLRNYPRSVLNSPVLFPAQNAHVIGVGAIARKEKTGAIAPRDSLSPFTRCGKTLSQLYSAQKPDAVEHGGNICPDGDSTGIGVVSYKKTGEKADSFIGTSFSAPLVAGHLAEIIAKYGNEIRNCEAFKALLFLSCSHRDIAGFGNGLPARFLSAESNQAVFLFEGSVKLSDFSTKGKWTEFYSQVSVPVPAATKLIEMCLVHSDNFSLSEPSLDTYLRVRARKSGSNSIVEPDNQEEQNKVQYVKFYRWTFKSRSMQAAWDFEIVPVTSRFIDDKNKKNITVRYGCAVLLSAPSIGSQSLTDDAIAEMNRWRTD
jgi:hypothetical protein